MERRFDSETQAFFGTHPSLLFRHNKILFEEDELCR